MKGGIFRLDYVLFKNGNILDRVYMKVGNILYCVCIVRVSVSPPEKSEFLWLVGTATGQNDAIEAFLFKFFLLLLLYKSTYN